MSGLKTYWDRFLALRLNQMIDYSINNFYTFSYFARMDADDISDKHRFEKQINFLEKNTNIDIVGSDVIEINESGEIINYKNMPTNHKELVNNIIKRCPFNHPTIMIRKNIFLNPSIRYDSELKNTQDYKLWVELISKGFTLANINEPLLQFRISNDFYKKRGISKVKNDINSRLYAIKLLNIHSIKNYLYIFLIFVLRISPKFMSKLAYKILR
ncbi:glycosyl transferase [Providencia stuartii]|uniref:glycosyltransferase n=1 Tax=Providencia stuartii TaxID=588 RepID=UPI0020227792|nr:glycosyltransferase [Providencia stuartii]URE79625.1 glycosyl transferase [Providencia stuartii]